MHVDQQGFLFISFPFQLPSLSLCSIYTACSLHQPPYPYFLLLSIEQFWPYCALHGKTCFLHGINTLQPSLLHRSASGAFTGTRTGDGYKNCAGYTRQGCWSRCQRYQATSRNGCSPVIHRLTLSLCITTGAPCLSPAAA